MSVSEAQKRANEKYKKANYEFFKLRFAKGDLDKIKEKAKEEGKSVNQYILDRIL